MPAIRVELFKSRTSEQKREKVSEITEAFVSPCAVDAKTVL